MSLFNKVKDGKEQFYANSKRNQSIGIGDQVFIAGLFFNHFGNQRNIPFIKSGNIAAMPEEPVTGVWTNICVNF